MKEKLLARYKEWGLPQDKKPNIKPCIRINKNLINPKKLIQRLDEKNVFLEKMPFLNRGYEFKTVFPLSSTIEFLLGYFYIQEAPSQIPGEIIEEYLKDKKFDDIKILEIGSAPGGKTTHLAEALRNKGKIVAIESSKERAEKLMFNLERMKVKNTDVLIQDATNLNLANYGKFDIILLDAPCSGNYTQSSDWLETRKIENFKNRQKLQLQLAKEALKNLKDDGILIYSTCSLEKEENEDVIETLLKENTNLTTIKNDINAGHPGITENTKNCIRIWPTQDKLPGFFIATLSNNPKD